MIGRHGPRADAWGTSATPSGWLARLRADLRERIGHHTAYLYLLWRETRGGFSAKLLALGQELDDLARTLPGRAFLAVACLALAHMLL